MNALVTTQESIDTVNKSLPELIRAGHHVLGNFHILDRSSIPEGFIASIEQVQLSPDSKNGGDVYPQTGGRVSLSARALNKISNAANIRWGEGGIDPTSTDVVIRYRQSASRVMPDGSVRQVTKDYEYDLNARQEQIYAKKCEQGFAIYDTPPQQRKERNFWPKNEEDVKQWARDKTRSEMLEKNKHKLTLAETGAKNRCIRHLLEIKSSYGAEEIQKLFLVLKIVYRPDMNHDTDRRYVLDQHFGNTQKLYPPPSDSPSMEAQRSEPTNINPASETSLDESENVIDPDAPSHMDIDVEPTYPDVHEGKMSAEESSVLDFEACDNQERVKIMNDLIHRKQWNGKLNSPIAQWPMIDQTKFYRMLLKLADPTKDLKKDKPLWE